MLNLVCTYVSTSRKRVGCCRMFWQRLRGTLCSMAHWRKDAFYGNINEIFSAIQVLADAHASTSFSFLFSLCVHLCKALRRITVTYWVR